jgi:hypothetical protein
MKKTRLQKKIMQYLTLSIPAKIKQISFFAVFKSKLSVAFPSSGGTLC